MTRGPDRCGGSGEVFPHPPDPRDGYVQAEQCRGCSDCSPTMTKHVEVPEGLARALAETLAGQDNLSLRSDLGIRESYIVLSQRVLGELLPSIYKHFSDRLLSDEAIDRAAQLVAAGTYSTGWLGLSERSRKRCRRIAKESLVAALQATSTPEVDRG